jgi:hypothetical protein
VPVSFIVEVDGDSTENDNVYVDVVVDLMAVYNEINGIANAV